MKKSILFVVVLILVIVSGIGIFMINKLNSKVIITNEELQSYVVKNELTKDNWKDYVEFKNLEEINKATNGEIYRKIKYTAIVPREGMMIKDSGFTAEGSVYINVSLKQEIVNGTDTILTCPIRNTEYNYLVDYYHPLSYMLKDRDGDVNNIDVDYTFNIDDIKEVIYAEGNMYTVQIPSEKWQEDENGKSYIIIETLNGEQKEITSDYIEKVLEYI